MNRSKQRSTHLYYTDAVLVVNRRESRPVKDCKMGPGIYEVLNVGVKRFKVDLRFLQEISEKSLYPLQSDSQFRSCGRIRGPLQDLPRSRLG